MAHRSLPIADAIFGLLADRASGATICPSEVARLLAPDDWRTLMPDVRAEACALAVDGRLEMRQRGETIVPTADPHGPIRLALPSREHRPAG